MQHLPIPSLELPLVKEDIKSCPFKGPRSSLVLGSESYAVLDDGPGVFLYERLQLLLFRSLEVASQAIHHMLGDMSIVIVNFRIYRNSGSTGENFCKKRVKLTRHMNVASVIMQSSRMLLSLLYIRIADRSYLKLEGCDYMVLSVIQSYY